MTDNGPILVTGAAGQLGAVGRTVCGLLLDRGLPVRAMVRREDDRAAALRAVAAASGAASVRVWHITSRGWDPWTERPLPEVVRVAYPLLLSHLRMHDQIAIGDQCCQIEAGLIIDGRNVGRTVSATGAVQIDVHMGIDAARGHSFGTPHSGERSLQAPSRLFSRRRS